MCDTDKEITPKLNETEKEDTTAAENVTAEPKNEPLSSMGDFEDQINNSFIKINEGEIVKGTVIGISETEVTVDLGYYAEGIIRLEDLSNDPRFSIKADMVTGQEVTAAVLKEDDGQGNILLSKKEADNILSWSTLKSYMDNKTIIKVKIAQSVNGGVVTYLEGIRGFIPASQLSLTYVENLASWVNKEISVIVITVDEDNKKLVLSGKEVERDKALEDKNSKISRLQIGLITKGSVEKIVPYGAFVNIGEGLSGLVHISQICGRRIKSPNEVIKEGEEVTVKIIEIKDGKVSLSIKAVEENAEVLDRVDEVPFEYSTGGEASTGLAGLLSKIKLYR
ncbi:MAG: S1 RNA-binding domain-containing protein [Anaerocolumna sp.]